ncbi:MAG: hypothetical protein CMN85_00620 [Spongiibacteraceae bacterium]|mgnify:CR=1 FL=1|nr:hypothetical protein [Spongiibacteraceae bacterium]
MGSLPFVSVIIPTFNRSATLLRAINSVLRQSHSHLELLIVDDGSTDETAEIVRSIDDERVRYIDLGRNCGVSVARNVGVEASRGKFIAFQDSDDEWLPDRLERQLDVFVKEPDTAFVFCSLARILKGGATRVIPSGVMPASRDAFVARLLSSNFIWTQTWLVRSEVIKKLGFDDDIKRIQDWDLALKIASKYRVVHVNEVLVVAYFTEGSLLSLTRQRALDLKIMLETQRDLLERHPAILGEYYRSIAVALRESDESGYLQPLYWAAKSFFQSPLNVSSWLTFGATLFGGAGSRVARRYHLRS